MHPKRLDFRVEVGSQLLCLGSTQDRRDRLDEGVRMMRDLLDEPPADLREQRELIAAKIMIESPAKACGYTGDTWIEIDAREAAALTSASR
jgi:hypothetical protein